MKIAIIGGNGFIGKYLVAKLHHDHQVAIFTRQKQLDPCFENILNITAFTKLSYDIKELKSYLAGYDVVINLVGILNEKGHSGDGFYTAHVKLTEKIMSACIQNGIPRYLHMSALHADAETGPSHYQRSKGQAENFVLNNSANVNVTCFCPSVIFGPGDSFCNRFADLIKVIPLAFPLACAKAKFAPIYAGDVADAFIDSISDETSFGKKINLCGPDVFTLGELVNLTAESLSKNRMVIGLPKIMAFSQAVFMEYFVPGKPFSIDNYNSLKVDSICADGQTGQVHLSDKINEYIQLKFSEQEKLIFQQ